MNVKTTRTIAKLITLSLLTATALHATNGDNLIVVGTKARGMGGVGIAVSHGSESALNNAAMITSVEGTEITFGGTLFMPDIHTSFAGNSAYGNPGDGAGGPGTNPMNPGSAFFDQENYRSGANRNVIPSVSIAHKVNENWFVGIGMFGTAGMGTDYRKAGTPGTITPPTGTGPQPAGSVNYGNFNMITNLQLMQFAVPIAYKTGGLSLAVTPILQYGNLDMNYNHPDPRVGSVGNGLAQDFGLGYNLGISYDFAANGVDGLTLGAIYKSSIEMDYDGQLTTALKPFLDPRAGSLDPLFSIGDTLEQPAEYGVGIGYTMGQHTVGFDYKKIKWSETKGYGDFGWEDQDVYSVGYQFAQDNWAVRAGYNYGSSAVVEGNDPRLNFFNLLGFPATSEKHYTVGGSYAFNDQFSLDLAYVYSPTNTETFDLGSFANSPMDPNQPGMGLESITNEHQENSVSFQLSYRF